MAARASYIATMLHLRLASFAAFGGARLIGIFHLFLHLVSVLKIGYMYGHGQSAQLGRCPHTNCVTRSMCETTSVPLEAECKHQR